MPHSRILVGVIGRAHGVRGLVRVTSYTEPAEAIASYGPLIDDRGRRFVLRWKGEGLAEIGEVTNGQERRVADRTEAERLTNLRLYVERDRLPAPGPEEFYLADLVGLAAFTPDGTRLGKILAVHDYGAGASLEIGADLVIPFTRAAVPVVDVARGRVVVELPSFVDAAPSPSPAPAAPARSLPQAGELDNFGVKASPALRERSARRRAPGEGRAR